MVESLMEEKKEDSYFSDLSLFDTIPAVPSLKLSVILPVRNEAENIIKALDALCNQQDSQGNKLPFEQYEVLLLANNCTDDSAAIARTYQNIYPDFQLFIEEISLPKAVAHIGTVRRILMDSAYNRFAGLTNPNGIIASTDSDSEVDVCWVYNTIREIENGNDVVGGRILTHRENSFSRKYYLRDINYKYLVSKIETVLDPVPNDPWPRHFQCFGASFAVTCRIYDLAGRLPVVPFLEDMAFHKALIRVDARIRLSPHVKVFTSTRIQGRVDFGLSIQLKQWGEMNQAHHPILVEPAEALFLKLKTRNLLRQLWTQNKVQRMRLMNELMTISTIFLIDFQWLAQQVEQAAYFGILWENIEEQISNGQWSQKWTKKDIVHVISDLKIMMIKNYMAN